MTHTSWGRRTSTGSTRAALMKQEIQYQAHQRILKEQYRPKILISEPSLSKIKGPQTYIKEARDKYLLKRAAKLNTTDETISTRDTTIRPATMHGHVSMKKIRLQLSIGGDIPSQTENSIAIPDWLCERKDFQQTIKRMKNSEEMTPAQICERDYTERSPEEKRTLLLFLKELEFFGNLPAAVLSDVADKMKTFTYESRSYRNFHSVAKQGEKGDCLFVVTSGTVFVHIDGKRVAEFTGNHVVGEAALQLDVPRTASILASTQVTTLRLSKIDFESTISVFKKKERRSAVEFLVNESVLNNLGHAKLQRLSNLLIATKFEPGQVIYDVEDVSQSFYVVKEGVVNIETYVNIDETTRWPVATHSWKLTQLSRKFRVLLKEALPGSVFGLADLPSKKGRKTRACAKTQSVCFIINLHQFLELFTERDLDQLLLCEELRIPKAKELVEKVHEDLELMAKKRKSMLKAYNISDDKFAARDWIVDQKTKRMRGWMQFMRRCMAMEVASMHRKVMSTSKSMKLVHSLTDLQNLRETKAKA